MNRIDEVSHKTGGLRWIIMAFKDYVFMNTNSGGLYVEENNGYLAALKIIRPFKTRSNKGDQITIKDAYKEVKVEYRELTIGKKSRFWKE